MKSNKQLMAMSIEELQKESSKYFEYVCKIDGIKTIKKFKVIK